MNILELCDIIEQTAHEDQRLNSIFIDDPYTAWNRKDVNYGSLTFYPISENNAEDYTDILIRFYVGELHNEAMDNTLELQALALDILHNLLHRIDQIHELSIVVPHVINLFEQDFQDVVCGVYGDVYIRIPNEFICD